MGAATHVRKPEALTSRAVSNGPHQQDTTLEKLLWRKFVPDVKRCPLRFYLHTGQFLLKLQPIEAGKRKRV
jgi:hypothetical protein